VVWGPVGLQIRVPAGRGVAVGVPVVFLVGRDVRKHLAEHFVQPPAHPIGKFTHPSILHRCNDVPMGLTEKAKELADTALRRAGELSETAREKAPGFLDRAADVTVKAVDSAAARIDQATGGRFHDRLEGAATKVEEGLDRAKPAEQSTTTVEVVRETEEEAPTTQTATDQNGSGPDTPKQP
jgi:hypothetical protein